jgi:beta-lactam-binding protein with PASTA domain
VGAVLFTQSLAGSKSMNSSTVFLIAFFTSLMTATGTVYLVERLNLIPGEEVKQVIVPNLQGLTEADAMANAKSIGLLFMIGSREPSADVKEGAVIRQSIPPGQNVSVGQPVTVTLAEALPKVPAVEGKTVDEATATLQQAGYQVIVGEPVVNDKVAPGKIVSQLPRAGSPLAKEQSITVRVAQGPSAVEVPKVVGLGFNPAKAKLEELGLKAKVRWVALAETASNVVLRQTPEAGVKSEPGTEIELVINRD